MAYGGARRRALVVARRVTTHSIHNHCAAVDPTVECWRRLRGSTQSAPHLRPQITSVQNLYWDKVTCVITGTHGYSNPWIKLE
jgi:hypothetical protein